MFSKSTVNINDDQDIDQVVRLIRAFKPNTQIDKQRLEKDLNNELELKKKEIKLTSHDVFDFVIDNFVDSKSMICIDYSWRPSELFERIGKYIYHNLIVVDEHYNQGFWDFSIKTIDSEKEIDYSVEFPEEIIDQIFNPLLDNKTDMCIIYPKGNQHSEVHAFFIVKKSQSQEILNHPFFV